MKPAKYKILLAEENPFVKDYLLPEYAGKQANSQKNN
jgi:hypothetical protein